jgi:hypothetical protein
MVPAVGAFGVGVVISLLVAWTSAALVPSRTFWRERSGCVVYPENAPRFANGARAGWVCQRFHHSVAYGMLLQFRAPNPRAAAYVAARSELPYWSRARDDAPQEFIDAVSATAPDEVVPANCVIEDARGWPFPAWASRFQATPSRTWIVERGLDLGGQQNVVLWSALPYSLPVIPIPLGIVGDGIVWGAIFLAARSFVLLMQRAARMNRGRCIRCSHLLQGNQSGICSECGTASDPAMHPATTFAAGLLNDCMGMFGASRNVVLGVGAAVGLAAAFDPTHGAATVLVAIAALPSFTMAMAMLELSKAGAAWMWRSVALSAIVVMVGLCVSYVDLITSTPPGYPAAGGILQGALSVFMALHVVWLVLWCRWKGLRTRAVVSRRLVSGCYAAFAVALLASLLVVGTNSTHAPDVHGLMQSLIAAPGVALLAGLLAAFGHRGFRAAHSPAS